MKALYEMDDDDDELVVLVSSAVTGNTLFPVGLPVKKLKNMETKFKRRGYLIRLVYCHFRDQGLFRSRRGGVLDDKFILLKGCARALLISS